MKDHILAEGQVMGATRGSIRVRAQNKLVITSGRVTHASHSCHHILAQGQLMGRCEN